MALDTQLSHEAANAGADAIVAKLNNGYLRLYSGTKPATGNSSLGAAVLLSEHRFGNPAFGNAIDGEATANAIASDTSANATGNATFFRTFQNDGSTPVYDGTVGTANANLILNSTAIQIGAQVDITSLTFNINEAGN